MTKKSFLSKYSMWKKFSHKLQNGVTMKKNLRKKMILGVASAAFMSAQVLAYADSLPQSEQTATMPMTGDEQAFADKLSSDAKDSFMKMNHEQRGMAMKIANHDCKGKNACKGQGGCKTEQNACKAQNACKGQGACKVSTTDAVKMAGKRNGSM